MFSCKKVTYVWDQERTEFVKLKGLDQGVGAEMLHKNRGLSNEEHFMRYGGPFVLALLFRSIVIVNESNFIPRDFEMHKKTLTFLVFILFSLNIFI